MHQVPWPDAEDAVVMKDGRDGHVSYDYPPDAVENEGEKIDISVNFEDGEPEHDVTVEWDAKDKQWKEV